MQKSVAGQKIGAQLVSATDGSAFTAAVTVYVTGDAGTQAIGTVGSGICTHEGNGLHSYAPSQAETNYDHIAFTFIGTGAVPVTMQVYTQFNALVVQVRAAVGLATANLDTQLADLPTVAEFEARTLIAANYALASGVTISGTTTTLDALQIALNLAHGAGSWVTATGFSTHAAADVWGVATRVLTAGTNIQLPSDGLALVTAWTVAITGNITGNLSGSVGSVTGAVTVTGDAATAGTRLLTAMELDGAVYRFTTNALEQSPTGGSPPTVGQIADAVWDEARTGHVTAGTFGLYLDAQISLQSAGATAAEVWAYATRTLTGSGGTIPAVPVLGDMLISENDFFARVDWNTMAQLCSDTAVKLASQAAVAASAPFLAALHSASAKVAASLIASGRYSMTTIYDIDPMLFGLIYDLMAKLIVCEAYNRRPIKNPDPPPAYLERVFWQLEAMKFGDLSCLV